MALASCKKSPAAPSNPDNPDTSTIVPPVEPPLAATMGFFLDDWSPRTFVAPAFKEVNVSGTPSNIVTVDASTIITKIPQSIFAQNAVFWLGPADTEPLFMDPLNSFQPHVLRFPGGSASDAYFWNEPQGVNPPDAPAQIMDKDGNLVDPVYNYGKTDQNWQCSLDQYYHILQQTHSQGLITVNYGYARYGTSADPVAAAAHLAADWVRYDNGRTLYWEIGNENFGDWEWGYRIDLSKNKDGQPEYITGALYAQHFQVFADSMRQAASETGKQIYIGAVTSESAPQSWETPTLQTWNQGMMSGINGKADFYVVHNYFTPYNSNSNAADILSSATTVPQQMMSYVTQALQSNGAAVKPIALDEWNMFAVGSRQMVSNTSGVFSVLVLAEALKNKFGLAARWDLLNGWSNGDDMGLFSAGDEPGIDKWNLRPSFYYMYFFKQFLGDRLIPASAQNSAYLKVYGSTFSSGQVAATLVNTGTTDQVVWVMIKNFHPGSRYYWYSLQGGNDNGEFSLKVLVNGEGPAQAAGGPADYATLKANAAPASNGIIVTVPARGAVCLAVDNMDKE
jgi:hypothetical protein